MFYFFLQSRVKVVDIYRFEIDMIARIARCDSDECGKIVLDRDNTDQIVRKSKLSPFYGKDRHT